MAELPIPSTKENVNISIKKDLIITGRPKALIASNSTISFIAGGAAGAISRTIVSPFERTKIIFQVQGPGKGAYNKIVPTLAKIWKEEGWKGMMRGNGMNCIRAIPYSAVQFSCYSSLKNQMLKYDGEFGAMRGLVAGAVGGTVSVIATYPLDLIRTRLSIQTASLAPLKGSVDNIKVRPPGMMEVMKSIYKTEGGFFALYRGIIPTTMGVAPYVGINFAVYEKLRMFGYSNNEQPSNLWKLTCGAISGGIAQTITYPFDLLRRRFQVLSMKTETLNGAKQDLGFRYNSVGHALRCIVKDEGIRGIYKGLSANLLKVVPSMAASFLSFEIIKDILE